MNRLASFLPKQQLVRTGVRSSRFATMTVRDALNSALDKELERDEKVRGPFKYHLHANTSTGVFLLAAHQTRP